MKSLLEISVKKSLQEFLTNHGKKAAFTSKKIFHVVLKDKSSWVFKLSAKDAEVIAEVVAYKISERLRLGLVPETTIFTDDDNTGSLQKFVDNTVSLDSAKYKTLISSTTEDIITLKLFCFLLGQWDIHSDNILLIKNGINNKIYAIDNANIADIQRVQEYGKPIFISKFRTSRENSGSIENPVKVQGDGNYILAELNKVFGEDLPKFFRESLPTSHRTLFEYFIEQNRVWLNIKLDNKEGTPNYVIPTNISKNIIGNIIEKVKNITEIFNQEVKEVIKEFKVITGNEGESLDEHFVQIGKGIEERYNLITKHFSLEDEVNLSGEV